MLDDDLKKYQEGRFRQMLDFYDRRAIQNKRWYRIFSLYIIVSSFLLAPFVAIDLGEWKPFTALLSSTIGMAVAVLSYFKFHENWLRYRSTWDCLTREPHFHAARIGDYQGYSDPNALFVERAEAMFAREGAEWLSVHACEEDIAWRKKLPQTQ